LNLSNLATLISYGNIEEVSIGHALIVECLDLGLEETIKRYLKILK
jgi:pyridoxine 5-phosphate synthase